MKIYEVQYMKNNSQEHQSRIITVENWEEYADQFKINPSTKNSTYSIPRNAKIEHRTINDKALQVNFFHPLFNTLVCHLAEIVSENNIDGVRCVYSEDYMKNVELNSKVDFSGMFNCSIGEVKREYYNQWIGEAKSDE